MRKARTRDDIQAQFAAHSTPRRGRRSAAAGGDGPRLDQTELVAAVCQHFCLGRTASEIVKLVRDQFKINLTREKPYQIISYAAAKGWIQFVAPRDHELREQVEHRHPWLAGKVEVVHTPLLDDVARRGARTLLELIRQQHARHPDRGEVHVGMSGGYSIRRVGQFLGDLLRQPQDGLPPKVVFHALVAGFPIEPTTAPNAFFLYLDQDLSMRVDTEFHALHAPAVVTDDFIPRLRELEPTKQAFDQVGQIDIYCTSAARWHDPDSVFRRYMSQCKESVAALEAEAVVGDMLWRPLGPRGPITTRTRIRAMTLVELPDLTRCIAQGKDVLLVLGPCAKCHKPKSDVMRTILEASDRQRLVTHLVADSRGVAEMLRMP